MNTFIDTHAHIDGEEYNDDRDEMIQRAKDAGVSHIFVPAINLESIGNVMETCRRYRNYAFPMIGLHPEDVDNDYRDVLRKMRSMLTANMNEAEEGLRFIAVGEVGLDYYWSREFENEQLAAFEEQVVWSIETRLPLMIHCRKAQNEMVKLLRKYEKELPGGVFHCFTGNQHEAEELLSFERFALGIGGVLTFKKSNLPETLKHLPIERIVLETDSPYMAPVPMRGKRNESAYTAYVLERMAECLEMEKDQVAKITSSNALRIFLP